MDGKLLTVKDVAARLNISATTVYRLWLSGKLHGRKLGTKIIRFTEEDIEEYINKNRRDYD